MNEQMNIMPEYGGILVNCMAMPKHEMCTIVEF